MVFYNTRVLPNQDQERFPRVPIPRSTKTKPCSTKTKMCAVMAFSDSTFNQYQEVMLFADKTRPRFVSSIFCWQFKQDHVSEECTHTPFVDVFYQDNKRLFSARPSVFIVPERLDRMSKGELNVALTSNSIVPDYSEFNGVLQDTGFVKPRP